MLFSGEYVVLGRKEEIISKIQWWTGTVDRVDNLKMSTGTLFGSSRNNSHISGKQHSIWYNKKFSIEKTAE
jgi:hypothetical protein